MDKNSNFTLSQLTYYCREAKFGKVEVIRCFTMPKFMKFKIDAEIPRRFIDRIIAVTTCNTQGHDMEEYPSDYPGIANLVCRRCGIHIICTTEKDEGN